MSDMGFGVLFGVVFGILVAVLLTYGRMPSACNT